MLYFFSWWGKKSRKSISWYVKSLCWAAGRTRLLWEVEPVRLGPVYQLIPLSPRFSMGRPHVDYLGLSALPDIGREAWYLWYCVPCSFILSVNWFWTQAAKRGVTCWISSPYAQKTSESLIPCQMKKNAGSFLQDWLCKFIFPDTRNKADGRHVKSLTHHNSIELY